MSATLAVPRHLLVRLPNPLGDAVMAVPALRALRQALPDTRITWSGGPAAQSVLEGLPYRDDVMPTGERDGRGRRAPMKAGRTLAGLGADAALLLPNSFSSALAVRRAGIPVRVGSDLHARKGLLSETVSLPKTPEGKLAPRSMVDHYLALAAPFGAQPDGAGPELRVLPFDEERAAHRLRDVPAGVPLLGVNPGAAFGPTKVYPPEHIAAAETREAGRGYTAAIMAAREVYISGESGLAELTSTVQSCVSLWEHGLSMAEVSGTDMITPSSLAIMARGLALRGEAFHNDICWFLRFGMDISYPHVYASRPIAEQRFKCCLII